MNTALLLGVAGLAALVLKLTDMIKAVKNKDWNTVVTLLAASAAGFVALLLYKISQFGDSVQITDKLTVKDLNFGSLVIVSIMITSLSSTVFDLKKAIDNTDSAKVEPLIKTNP